MELSGPSVEAKAYSTMIVAVEQNAVEKERRCDEKFQRALENDREIEA